MTAAVDNWINCATKPKVPGLSCRPFNTKFAAEQKTRKETSVRRSTNRSSVVDIQCRDFGQDFPVTRNCFFSRDLESGFVVSFGLACSDLNVIRHSENALGSQPPVSRKVALGHTDNFFHISGLLNETI